jgi:hypothetical protein
MERIIPRPVGSGESSEIAAAIGGEQRHGFIDGVEVDFRHPELPLEWVAAPFWHVWADGRSHAGLIFPEEAVFPLDELRDLKGLPDDFPAIYVREGDRLSIASVVVSINDPRFDHPHDYQEREARLKIERASGEVEFLEKGLTFLGAMRVRNGATRHSFDNIAARICSHAGKDDLEPREGSASGHYWEMPLEQIALDSAWMAREAYQQLLRVLPEDGAPGAKLERAYLRKVINRAALAGFLLGKVEARKPEKMAGSSLINLELAQQARVNQPRRDAAEAAWKKHPTWRSYRIAKLIALPGEDVGGVSKSIKHLAPPTSPSFQPI